MQLVAGRRFFFNGFQGTRTARGVEFRQAPALTMQWLGWTPILFDRDDDPDSVVAQAREAGAMGLKLYAQLDSWSRSLPADRGRAPGGHAGLGTRLAPAGERRRADPRGHGRRGPRRRHGG